MRTGIDGKGYAGPRYLFEQPAGMGKDLLWEKKETERKETAWGGFGFFYPCRSMKEYTCAGFLQDEKEPTQVFLRFQGQDYRKPRSAGEFGIRFYTREGNYDLTGSNLPVSGICDGSKYGDWLQAQGRDREVPKHTEQVWDFYSRSPETLHMLMWLYSPQGRVQDYRTTRWFGGNTFVWVTGEGKRSYVRYQLLPEKERKDCFGYGLWVQVMDMEQESRLGFEPFDGTRLWPEESCSLIQAGTVALEGELGEYEIWTEQAPLDLGNLVPGIEISQDMILQGKRFECGKRWDPRQMKVSSLFRTGPWRGEGPGGFLKSQVETGESVEYEETAGEAAGRKNNLENGNFQKRNFAGNGEQIFVQASKRYQAMTEEEQMETASAIGEELSVCSRQVQERELSLFHRVNRGLAWAVMREIGKK